MKDKGYNMMEVEEKLRHLEERIMASSEAKIYSTYPLSEEEQGFLKENVHFLKNKRLINIVEKNLITGLIIETEDQVIDLSLRGRLNKLRNLLYEAST
jgi:ATP synthase F1 delta subunit